MFPKPVNVKAGEIVTVEVETKFDMETGDVVSEEVTDVAITDTEGVHRGVLYQYPRSISQL